VVPGGLPAARRCCLPLLLRMRCYGRCTFQPRWQGPSLGCGLLGRICLRNIWLLCLLWRSSSCFSQLLRRLCRWVRIDSCLLLRLADCQSAHG
jgi:hypothetical protein